MEIKQTMIEGVEVIETNSIIDQRGEFSRLYCDKELAHSIGSRHIVQINHARTHAVGTVRGLHYQHSPHMEMRFARCVKGRVWDIAVDLRAGSRTLLKWHAEELTPDNARMLVIPEGCAHGYQVLEANSELLYLSTAFYAPEFEGGIMYDDPQLAITWPLPAKYLSVKDVAHPPILEKFSGIRV